MRNPERKRSLVHWMFLAAFAVAPTVVFAQEVSVKPEAVQPPAEAKQEKTDDTQAKPQAQEEGQLKAVPGGKALGMSILGNQEAPKALVIVPWKSSELGNVLGISTLLDDSKQPIDKEVFMRMLSYYEIRSESASKGTTPAAEKSPQPKAATQSVTQRRK